MKTKALNIIFFVLLLPLLACTPEQGGGQKGKGNGQGSATITTELDQVEKDGLLYMWEEEKLARDVYITLGNRYGDQTLLNISNSEQKHMNAVKNLLSQVGLLPPVNEGAIGLFQNATLAQLYGQLIQRGNISLTDAHSVGLDIEILDIDDLNTRIDQTDDPGIQKVYGNLLNGSYNHKAAFESRLN